MGELFNREIQTPLRQQLRNRMTYAEKILWYYLRGKGVAGCKFRRQYGVGQYIVDFYCPSAKLVVEVDGDSHYQTEANAHDTVRQRFIEQQGIRVIRFTDNDVRTSLPAVIEKIEKSLTPSNSPLKRGRKEKSISSPCKGEESPPASARHERAGRGLSIRGL